MRELLEVNADEPVDELQAQGIAAIVYSEEDDWSIGLDVATCRVVAKRLLELAAEHERKFGKAVMQ